MAGEQMLPGHSCFFPLRISVYADAGVYVPFRRCSQRLRGNGHYKASMLHPFQSDQLAGKLLHCRRLAMHDKHLQAGIVIEMRVAGGDDQFVMFVLQIGQLFADTVLRDGHISG